MYKSNDLKLSQFRFKLPEEQIAQFPSLYRDEARMLVLHRKTGEIEHKQVTDILSLFTEGDAFVFNDTKVVPARLFAKKEKTNANIEVFLLRELNHENRFWDVLVDPARKIRIGNKLFFDEDPTIIAEVIDNVTSRGRTFRFLTDYTNEEFTKKLYSLGTTPLPKYIHRPLPEDLQQQFDEQFRGLPVDEMDHERYQSVFARNEGAVAAPAASLHFSKQLLKRMEIGGFEFAFMTSHMSLGNFRPVDVEDLTKFKSDSERIIIPQQCVDIVEKARETEHHVCAVGTEIMRALEHVAGTGGHIKPYDGWTNKFLYPPYSFSAADSFFVNLYMPMSSQQLMVAAFGGFEEVMNAYNVAVQEGYRFGDYGDSMLIID
ncbi:MAG: tRNA preQ1(34) S-adenosylmethionine ribosyltransferase-isomerase QueA [Paludibacteraceae bacterium]|nr:tRNA preQ1(34) S-adenosylmethionine ribosyltransferase-isomerase QueA [Paludibacteraceae bacterium]